MNYESVDFMEVRRLVLEQEQEQDLPPDIQPRLDDSILFRASDEVHRAKLAICNLRERAEVINKRFSLPPQLGEQLLQRFEEERSIWFDEAISSELLCMIPVAVARCPDLLSPEILVHAMLTIKYAGLILKACLEYFPILRRDCIAHLADFIFKWIQIKHAGTCYKPSDLLFYCVQQSYSAMESLFQSDPQIALILREALLQRCICLDIIFQITIEVLKDGTDFITKMLFSDEETCQWILSCIRSIKKATEICSSAEVGKLPKFTEAATSILWNDSLQLKEATVLQLCKALHVSAEASFREDGWTSSLYSHLKLFCVLVNLGGLQPVHEEVIFWLRALMVESSRDYEKDTASKNLIPKRRFELGVAYLFLIPGLRDCSLKEKLFRECILFFLGPATSGLASFVQGSEITLWLVVQLSLQCYARVSEYCSKAIGMNITISITCWEDVCRIAYETGITLDTKNITNAVCSLRPTGPICTTKSDQLVIECMFQLLKAGHFVRCGVDITESIMQCILLSVEPIHPILVQVIEIFAEASYTPTSINSSDGYKMHCLPWSFLVSTIKPFSSFFSVLESMPGQETGGMAYLCESTGGKNYSSNFSKNDSAVHAVLASFYILCREQFHRTQRIYSGNCNYNLDSGSDDRNSWSKLLRFLPLEKLLKHMESRHHFYEHMFTRFVGLAISLFPERLHVGYWIQRLEGDSIAKQMFCHFEEPVGKPDQELQCVVQNRECEGGFNLFSGSCSIELACQVFRNSSVNSISALKLLKTIQAHDIPARDKHELQIVIMEDLLPLLLNKSSSESLQEAFCEWWYSLDQSSVESLVPLFCHCIMSSDMDVDIRSLSPINDVGLFSASKFYQELVEQPLSILTCNTEIYHTPLISIFLDILRELLVRNRSMCVLASMKDGEVTKEETLRAVDTRDSAVCQILLENWSRMFSLGLNKDAVHKAGSLICAFISSLFYSNPSIFRLVHFQGYDMKLIPAVTECVTLIIHSLEFFEDSLKLVELSKLPFMVVVLSNIIRRYPNHSRSFNAARKALTHIRCIDLETTIKFLGETLEPVAWFAITFPLLEPEVREYLERCGRAMHSGEISSEVYMEEFRSSALSALGLLKRYGT